MKQLLLLPLMSIGVLQHNNHFNHPEDHLALNAPTIENTSINIGEPQEPQGNSRMAAAVFKAQEYCRAELKDFEFDARFIVVSAVVYFSGAGFKNGVEKGSINSNSLKPIRSQMDRCTPGSVVIFDEVKVKGPDNTIRTIPGISLILY
ncbi:MAG: GldM family protein [Bacteroidota bacterium]